MILNCEATCSQVSHKDVANNPVPLGYGWIAASLRSSQ
jgi:hypothetical protein